MQIMWSLGQGTRAAHQEDRPHSAPTINDPIMAGVTALDLDPTTCGAKEIEHLIQAM